MNNPFDITKAVDFTDEQIIQYWVDISDEGGFKELLKPTSVMPMIILGSKGSGKTHLMKYFSYELQKIKHKKDIIQGLEEDKFIGVYVRCSGFNSDRFSKKGQSEEVWAAIYAYYWELWIAQISLSIIIDLIRNNVFFIANEKELTHEIISLLNREPDITPNTLEELHYMFSSLQKKVDYEVQNCIFNEGNKLSVDILISPASITYGLPALLTKTVPFFQNKIFLYLIDELENISENQQRLIQTLIREKNTSCTFRLGARLYGVRTYMTLGTGEENRKGSEYDEIVLDEFLRRNDKNYVQFMRRICEHRLRLNGIFLEQGQKIEDFIDSFNKELFFQKIDSKKTKYFNKLRDKLKGKISTEDIDNIISNLSFENPLIERTNLLLFYRAWKKNRDSKDLVLASLKIRSEALEYSDEQRSENNSHAKVLDKYRRDLIDVLARETRQSVPYFGFDDFIKMSSGTPRNLLNLLKHSYKWTYFDKAKEAFKETSIDFYAQEKGIKDTIDWFFEDNRIPAAKHGKLIDCIEKLGRFLRDLKYSDIPPECSINLFGLNLKDLSSEARENFNLLENYSYIISAEDRRDKNSNDKFKSYYINGTIIPHWELSLSKRGIVILSSEEAEAIFNLTEFSNFEELLNSKIQKYNAPFTANSVALPNLFPDEEY